MSYRLTIHHARWLTGSVKNAGLQRSPKLPELPHCFFPSPRRSLHFPQYPPTYKQQETAISETSEKLLVPNNITKVDSDTSGGGQHHDDSSNKSLVSERDQQLYSENNNTPIAVQWYNARECLRSLDDATFSGLRGKLEAYRRLGRVLLGSGEVEGVRTRWFEIGYRKSLYALVGCLSLNARDALTALEAITIVPDKFIVTVDALLYIRHARWHEIEQDLEIKQRFYIQVAKLHDKQQWPKGYMSSKCLDLMLDSTEKNEARKILRDYLDAYSDLREQELIYVVHRFQRLGDADSALSLLRTLPPVSLQQEQGAVLAACINLMNLESVDRAAQPYSLKILPALLELGLRPNVGVYNKAVQNAFDLGLPKVGWDLYRHMQTQDVLATPATILELLRDSFLHSNLPALNEMMTLLHEGELLRAENPFLVGYLLNIVRYICYWERKSGSSESLAHLLSVYDRAYNRTPLVKLGLIRKDQVSQGNERHPNPDPPNLAFMVWSYVYVQRREANVADLWQRIDGLIQKGDKQVIEMARHPVLYNGFMTFYSRAESRLSKMVNILHHLLRHDLCIPDDHSWSIMICGMLKHEKHEWAEMIRRMMLRRGVKVTKDAWKMVMQRFPDSDVMKVVNDILEGKEMPLGTYKDVRATETSSLDTNGVQVEKLQTIWDTPEDFRRVQLQRDSLVTQGDGYAPIETLPRA